MKRSIRHVFLFLFRSAKTGQTAISKLTQMASVHGAEHRPPPTPLSRTPVHVSVHLQQPLQEPYVLVLFDVRMLSKPDVSALGQLRF